ncbi:MAG: homoserine kinase [Elusimicrobia bacterium]|nr:MAG: homoserine kinase [Elusimicrobiota bacterium]
MSVFTRPPPEELTAWLAGYPLGHLRRIEEIAEGVQNSNFYLATATGEYVLTIVEQASGEAIDFHTRLMAHLASRGIPCPAPLANHRQEYVTKLVGKPAVIVSRLPGAAVRQPTPTQCAAVGTFLADLHLAAATCPAPLHHLRDTSWCVAVAEQVMARLTPSDASLLADELCHQRHARPLDLPRGVIHADLFRDNVLFLGDRISGVVDFYFAGVDDWLFDLAVTVNDWCTTGDGHVDDERSAPLLAAYDACRPLLPVERSAWPTLLRAAALRFWLSRLYDCYLPRPGNLVTQRDPEVFRKILFNHRAAASPIISG